MQNQIKSATFRFYAELNDFLPPRQRHIDIPLAFKGRQTVKHLIESLGVPHPEVDLIIVNSQSVDFDTITHDGDRVSVYPVFTAIDITNAMHLHPQPLGDPRFILDGHLGRLAAYLRMLGFDTAYHNDITDETLADQAVSQDRILLTRDRGLLKRKAIQRGYCLRATDPLQQLREIVHRFDLSDRFLLFTRCMVCNGLLQDVEKSAILHLLELRTRQFIHHFKQCSDCGKVYWRGHHTERMEKIIQDLNLTT
jgi:uncharacterized protein